MVTDAVRWRARDRFGEDSPDAHYWGALGEIAFAKWIGVPWHCHSGDGARPDVAGYEVRSIRPSSPFHVKAKRNDRPGTKIVVVAHLAGGTAALIVGWITKEEIVARAGSTSDWGNRKAPAYLLQTSAGLHRNFPPPTA